MKVWLHNLKDRHGVLFGMKSESDEERSLINRINDCFMKEGLKFNGTAHSPPNLEEGSEFGFWVEAGDV